jgi:hypothetical protein
VREWHLAFDVPYVLDCITELCRKQAELIPKHANSDVRGIVHGEAMRRKYERQRLKLCGG